MHIYLAKTPNGEFVVNPGTGNIVFFEREHVENTIRRNGHDIRGCKVTRHFVPKQVALAVY